LQGDFRSDFRAICGAGRPITSLTLRSSGQPPGYRRLPLNSNVEAARNSRTALTDRFQEPLTLAQPAIMEYSAFWAIDFDRPPNVYKRIKFFSRQASQPGSLVLHPNQFQVNEAWIAFTLNEDPIHTEVEGDFNFLALMDAASCFILASATMPTSAAGLSKLDAKRLLKEGTSHHNQLLQTLFIPKDHEAKELASAAQRLGITVVRVPEDQLLVFTGEARQGFREHFGSTGDR
jgi:hypothetical protein